MLKNRVLKNTAWIIFGQVAQMLISFFISMVTARYLGPSNYGILSYVASYLAFASAFCTLGLNNIIINELIKGKDQQGKLLGTCITFRVVSSMLATLCMVFVIAITNQFDTLLITVALLQSVSLVFEAFDLLNYWFQSKLLSKYVSLVKLLASLLSAGYKIYILVAAKDILWFAFSASFEMIFYIIFLYTVYKRNKGPKFEISKTDGLELLHKSKHFIISGLMVSFYGQMDKIMLGIMIDNTSVGLYSTAVYLCGLWSFIPSAIIDSARPVISELKLTSKEWYEKRIIQLYSVIIWMCILFGIFIMIFGDWIINLLYGPAYAGATSALKVISWYCIFAYLGVARNIWLVIEGKYKYEKYIAFIGVVANLILNTLLIPIMGIVGAALATLITQFVTNVVSQFLIKDMRENGKFIVRALFFQFNKKKGD